MGCVRSVVGCFLIHLCLGSIYLWSTITLPVTSYLRRFDPTLTYYDTIVVFAAALGIQGAFMILGGYLEKQFNSSKSVIILGTFLVAASCFCSSFVTTLASLLVLYGCLFGIGIGMSYTSTIALCVRWNPEHKSLVTGCIVCGIGLGAFIFGFLSNHIVNPHGVPVGEDGYYPSYCAITERVPIMFRTLGAMYACLITIGCSLIVDLPHDTPSLLPLPLSSSATSVVPCDSISIQQGRNLYDEDLKEQARESRSASLASSDKEGRDSRANSYLPLYYGALNSVNEVDDNHLGEEYPFNQNEISLSSVTDILMLRDAQGNTPSLDMESEGEGEEQVQQDDDDDIGILGELYPTELVLSSYGWQLSACYVMTTVGGVYLAGNIAELGGEYFSTTSFLTAVVSSSSLFNGFGRPLWGALADRFGAMKVMQVMSFVFALIIYTYNWASSLQNQSLFCVWTFSIFFFLGGNFCLYFPITISMSGKTHAASNYGLIFLGLSICEYFNIILLARYKVKFADASTLLGTLCMLGCININWLAYRLKSRQSRHDRNKTAYDIVVEPQNVDESVELTPIEMA